MAGGSAVNRPKSALQRNSMRAGRIKRKQKKKHKTSKKGRVIDCPTTMGIRKSKTKSKGNITLSGKKKRLLIKAIKREQNQKLLMELDKPDIKEKGSTNQPEKMEKMDLDLCPQVSSVIEQ